MTRTQRAQERGAIAVFMMLILTVVMGFAAIAFDLSYVRLARLEMKNATDAASHAAMYVLRATKDKQAATDAAVSVASQNSIVGYSLKLSNVIGTDVKFGTWDFTAGTFTASATTANAVQVNGHVVDATAPDGTVLTTFGRTLGVGSANVAQTSYGAYRPRTTMFEMDITGSFEHDLDTAIDADLAFLDDMCGTGVTQDKIGLDIFTGVASNVTPLTQLATTSVCTTMRNTWQGTSGGIPVYNHLHTSGIGMCTKNGVRRQGDENGSYSCLTPAPSPCPSPVPSPCPKCWANQATVNGKANLDCAAGDKTIVLSGVTTTLYDAAQSTYGGTNIGAAIKSGIDALGVSGRNYDVQSIVVFTDGSPSCCEAIDGANACTTSGHPAGCCADGTDAVNGTCQDNIGGKACACAKNAYDYGIQEADVAASKGIDVYVLAFDSSGTHPAWFTYAKALARGRGFELDATNAAALKTKLQQIADNIPISLAR